MGKSKRSHKSSRKHSKQSTAEYNQRKADEIVPPPLPSFGPIPEFNLSINNSGPYVQNVNSKNAVSRSPRKRDFGDISDEEVSQEDERSENGHDRSRGEVKRQRTDDSSRSPSPTRRDEEGEWTTVSYKPRYDATHVHKRDKKGKEKKKAYPEFVVSPQKLRGWVRIGDLQMLALNLLADGIAPQWLLIKV